MDRRNYFEVLGLDFDPPEKNQRRIDKAIAEWKKRTEDMLANETIAERRAVLSDELSLHDNMVETLHENKTRNVEARTLKEVRTQQLEQLVDIMLVGQSGTPEVTNAQIRNVHLKLKLSPKTIEDTYVKKGFVVQRVTKAVNLNDAFLTTVVAGNISSKISQLQAMAIHKYPWTSKVTDLYDLACYFCGGSDSDTGSYHKKRTTELYSIMESWAAQFASDMSAQGHLLADLFTAGTTQVFNTEVNRKKYDQSLEREKLKAFFSLLKSAPEDFKKDRYFADSCIRTIQKSFPDYNLSLALYNQEAGLMQDSYEPLEALIHLTCGSCKTPAEFRTREDAEKGKCTVCGAPLYIECPKCHKSAPAIADRCSCGFLVSEMQFFDEYIKAAEFALKEMDFGEASKQYANAENAFPRHQKLSELSQRIKAERDKYDRPLNELKALIAARMFCKAQTLLGTLSASMPQLKLDSQKKVIDEKMAEVKRRMPAGSLSSVDKANRCVEILQIVEDYQPAIDVLISSIPRKPLNLNAAVMGTASLTCTLSWNATGDKGIKYQVVRKKNDIPQRQADGEVLATDIGELSYKDTSLQPGISYGYAVFACRLNVFSDPSICEIVNFSELATKYFRTSAENAVCRFSWVLPPNCIGVRILRSTNAIPAESPSSGSIVVAAKASANFDDAGVSNNNTYGYRLQCVYPYESSFRYSRGVTVMLKPEPPPIALRNITSRIEGRLVTIRWNSPDNAQQSVLIREVLSNEANSLIGQVISATDINLMIGNVRNYANTMSTSMQAQFEIPSNMSCSLAVICVAGSKGIISDIVRVSSVEKCEIDKCQTRIEGNRLRIVLANRPKNLERIHYIVAKKTGATVPWATIEDAKKKSLSIVSLHEYERDGMILVETIPKTDLYISVIGQYKMSDESIIYSEPSKLRLSNKPKEKISYRFTWGTSGFFGRTKAKNCKLTVSSNAEEIPEIYVVYKSDGHIPMKLLDPKTVIIHTVPESDIGFKNGEYVCSFQDSTWNAISSATPLRLFIQEDYMSAFEITPSDIESCKVP
ncbi:fibronectin type III domain-containing protein [Eubacteriaceae bacterium ES3]|nr:fibronectin type III domain-containing protein [Eubacteriaceae bacterium ES3]